MKGRLPLAARSLQSWTRLAITVEGGPVPEEIVYFVAIEMIQNGYIYHGFWVLTQYDTYGREQDMEQLCGADISYHKRTMALVFGVSSRGESVKTGHNQGVLVRRAVVADILLALKKDAGANKIFPITQEELRRVWHRVLRRLGLPFAGPPHSLGHSGPSEDLHRSAPLWRMWGVVAAGRPSTASNATPRPSPSPASARASTRRRIRRRRGCHVIFGQHSWPHSAPRRLATPRSPSTASSHSGFATLARTPPTWRTCASLRCPITRMAA